MIHHRWDGPDDAPVLVLSNSLGLNLGMWDSQLPLLGQRFRLLRYDSRGHGASPILPGPYTLDQLGGDVLELLDRLGVARAHFCGLSIGGVVGQWLGLHAPDRLHRLVLANTAARIGTTEVWDLRMEAVRRGGVAAVADATVERWFTADFRGRDPGTAERMRQVLLAISPDAYLASCAALRDLDLREEVSDIRIPTLVIAGSADTSTPPAGGRFLADRIAGARYVELASAHLSNVEAAEAFGSAVVGFLEG